ncbi:MAG: hypothetical protein Q8R18_03350 [bacterium]|nr:hypothetical protein [bacterium]
MSLDQIALGLVRDYPQIKYSVYATLQGYAMYWDEEKKDSTENPRNFPKNSYYHSWKSFIEKLKTKTEWKIPKYRLPDTPIFEKQNILAQALANKKIVRDAFLEEISPELQRTLADILFERNIIAESADLFIDTFDYEKVKKDPERNPFEHFLEHFDIDQRSHKQKPKKSYLPLLTRLKNEGDIWEEIYIERLKEKDEILAQRIQSIFEGIEANNFDEQERMKIVELLTEKGCVGLVERLGQDAYDILVAMYGEEQFPEEKRHILSSGKAIRPYLGKCRRKMIRSEFNIWERDLIRTLKEKGLRPSIYDKNITVQRILQTTFLAPYIEMASKGEDPIVPLQAQTKEEDVLTKKLARYGLEHFQMMREIQDYPEISHTLAIVRAKKDL